MWMISFYREYSIFRWMINKTYLSLENYFSIVLGKVSYWVTKIKVGNRHLNSNFWILTLWLSRVLLTMRTLLIWNTLQWMPYQFLEMNAFMKNLTEKSISKMILVFMEMFKWKLISWIFLTTFLKDFLKNLLCCKYWLWWWIMNLWHYMVLCINL